jgi:hypothetical protein
MGIEFSRNLALFRDVVSVDEAEGLLEWVQKNPAARIDLSFCAHLHPANLQVLMATRAKVIAWPADSQFAAWLKSALAER